MVQIPRLGDDDRDRARSHPTITGEGERRLGRIPWKRVNRILPGDGRVSGVGCVSSPCRTLRTSTRLLKKGDLYPFQRPVEKAFS